MTTNSSGKSAIESRIKALDTIKAAGLELFPLRSGADAKKPRDAQWNIRNYKDFKYADWLKRGNNVGVRPRLVDLIVDVDPRNGGDVSLDALLWDLDLKSLDTFPTIATGRGDGGRHYYMQVPEGDRWRHTLKAYPGIEFQTINQYVVAPGSIHPDTGKPYVIERAFPSEVPNAPEALLNALRKPPRAERSGDGGEISCAQLAELLTVLDPADFGQDGEHHDEWLDLAMACHDGTNGDGLEEWLDWCAGDPRYGDDARNMNTARWDSFESGQSGGVTYKTLLQAVARTGAEGKRLVADLDRVSAAEDFDDDIESADEEKPKDKATRFRRWSLTELMALPPASWLVEGLIPSGGLVQLYGARKRNKTFVALDLALCVATGREFHGVSVEQGRVTYVIAEGGADRFADRILAWCQHNHVEPEALDGVFHVVPVRVGVDNDKDLKAFLLADKEPSKLTVFDTLARSMDGDENSTRDMGAAIKGLDRVREHYTGAVMVVHHSGHDESHGRGSTALPGAVDATLKVFRDKAKRTVLWLEESRNAAAGKSFQFEPVTKVLSDDLQRNSIALRHLEYTDIGEPKTARDKVLVLIVEQDGIDSRDALVDQGVDGLSQSSVYRAITSLLKEKLIEEDGGIFATEKGELKAIGMGATSPEDTTEGALY